MIDCCEMKGVRRAVADGCAPFVSFRRPSATSLLYLTAHNHPPQPACPLHFATPSSGGNRLVRQRQYVILGMNRFQRHAAPRYLTQVAVFADRRPVDVALM